LKLGVIQRYGAGLPAGVIHGHDIR
jgi:hypothetical protein